MDTRQIEIQSAAQNPNIISTLSGAQPQTTMSPQGGLPQELMKPAQDISSRLYGSGFVSGAEGGRDAALKAMFDADQSLDKKYSALPSPEWYVQNPADTMKATAGYVGNLGQVAGTSQGAASDVERAYGAAIQGVLSQLMDFMKLDEDKKDREEQRKQERFDNELSIAKLLGGNVTNPFTGEKVYVSKGGGVTDITSDLESMWNELSGEPQSNDQELLNFLQSIGVK